MMPKIPVVQYDSDRSELFLRRVGCAILMVAGMVTAGAIAGLAWWILRK